MHFLSAVISCQTTPQREGETERVCYIVTLQFKMKISNFKANFLEFKLEFVVISNYMFNLLFYCTTTKKSVTLDTGRCKTRNVNLFFAVALFMSLA